MPPSEASYQAKLVNRIQELLPGCYVFKNDPEQRQGIPDLLILWGSWWAMLEVKRSANEPFQPNQEYYLDVFGQMSFAAVIFPENEREVLHELQQALSA